MSRSVRRSVVELVPHQRRRNRPARDELPVETIVTATLVPAPLVLAPLVPVGERAPVREYLDERRAIVELARRPVSLVEIGAALTVPVALARALVRDLVGAGYVVVHPPPAFADGTGPSAVVLARLLRGLRA